jgi:hypothetical protein
VTPPAISATSPIHELLVLDVAAGAPWELREPLRGARTVEELNDWIAATAMYRSVENDAAMKRLFLDHLEGGPKQATIALARTMAAGMLRTTPKPPRVAPAIVVLAFVAGALISWALTVYGS